MRILSSSLFLLLNLALAVASLSDQTSARFSRDDFPSHFVFGAGTSAYQVEGAALEEGRTPSIWDTFAHSGKMKDKNNGDIACDGYHKYKEDVQLMVDTGLDAYRFSISWSRLIPNGRGIVNPRGLQYYNSLINELIRNGIQPHVTLFHYDLPQTLEDEYGGWLSQKIVNDFTAYADVCFREFGDRVSHWTTLNEPNVFVLGGYDIGMFAPGRCSSPFGFNCTIGNSTTEPYIVTHNILLAHASAARLYKDKYQGKQHGLIGLNVFVYWFIPFTNTTEDKAATQRANDFYVGWYIDPLFFGDYPATVKKIAGSRIPSFTPNQSKQIKGSYDFIGLNHYNTLYVKDDSESFNVDQRDVIKDMAVKLKGQRTFHNASLNDTSRVKYLDSFLGCLLQAVRDGSNTRGYFVWSFLDLFELMDGYESSYGLYYVNLKDQDLKRYPKLSAHWYSNFLKGRSINTNRIVELDGNYSSSQSPTPHISQ
uniref:Beta-glucosidase 11-like n=1 Tax=Nelumbo nucifera TaxID=4432 RepID=A0A822Z967_NELNU|nr:TPA_asm: hypothetical protein HUJ06_008719 [Nelumbo nucifera]